MIVKAERLHKHFA